MYTVTVAEMQEGMSLYTCAMKDSTTTYRVDGEKELLCQLFYLANAIDKS